MSLQHTRQHLPVRGKASAATARKLNATRTVAPHVTAATIECDGYAAEIAVVACRSKGDQIKCGVALDSGQIYYMVRSRKFTNRWYVFAKNVCSSPDRALNVWCAAQVEAFKASKLVAA